MSDTRPLTHRRSYGSLAQFFLISLIAYATLLPFLSWVVFSEDDSHLMRVAVDYSWWQHYLVPEIYQQLSAANYTPVAMSFYKLLTNVFEFRPQAFLAFMMLTLALLTALAGRVVELVSRSRPAALLAMLLIFSNMSVMTLLVRFYTMHYIIGGIFALIALVLVIHNKRNLQSAVLIGLMLLLALLSKEVYLMLPPLLILLALYRRDYSLAAASVVALLVYLLMRTYILGVSVDVGAQSSYFAGAWSASGEAWSLFLVWYVKTRVFILLAIVAALILNLRRTLTLLPLAIAFLIPSLAVAHGINEFALHGDRLFFVFDSALAMIAAIAIMESPKLPALIHKNIGAFSAKGLAASAMLAVVIIIHITNSNTHQAQVSARTDYKITAYILGNQASLRGKTLFVPLEFIQGDLMRVNNALGNPPYEITQNCLYAQSIDPERLVVFDGAGDQIPRAALVSSCPPAQTSIGVVTAPRYNHGILEWELQIADGFSGGVLFVDRAFAVPIPVFARQLVRPRPGERYQLFARNQTGWWFSEVETMQITP
ncbi:MAG: hypothetical protein Q7L19_10295 [Pseudohongiella sp.]|nr:hypothetical protein [Pseudohongiella sp.]